jgi:EAL domain-containing protein
VHVADLGDEHRGEHRADAAHPQQRPEPWIGLESPIQLHIQRADLAVQQRQLPALRGLQQDAAARALVTAVVLLALEMGASVIAEGIESLTDLQMVAALGVDDTQGYFLARPDTDPEQWARWANRAWTVLTRAVASAAPAGIRRSSGSR